MLLIIGPSLSFSDFKADCAWNVIECVKTIEHSVTAVVEALVESTTISSSLDMVVKKNGEHVNAVDCSTERNGMACRDELVIVTLGDALYIVRL